MRHLIPTLILTIILIVTSCGKSENDVSESVETTLPTTYTIREVAKILHVTEQTVRKTVHEGALSAFHVGTNLRITREALLNFIRENRAEGPLAVRDPRRGGKKPTGRRPKVSRKPAAKRTRTSE